MHGVSAMTPDDCATFDISGLNFAGLAAQFGVSARAGGVPPDRRCLKEAIARTVSVEP
jgi:hypothetical protein